MKEKSPKRFLIAHTVIGLILKILAALVLLKSGSDLLSVYNSETPNYESLRTASHTTTFVIVWAFVGIALYVLGLVLDLAIHHGTQGSAAGAPPPALQPRRPGPTPPPMPPAPAEKKTSPKITDDPGPVYYLD